MLPLFESGLNHSSRSIALPTTQTLPQVLPLFESGIPLLRERLRQLPDASNITIAYPDEGAWKRFHYQFGDYPEVCSVPLRSVC